MSLVHIFNDVVLIASVLQLELSMKNGKFGNTQTVAVAVYVYLHVLWSTILTF